MNALVEIKDLAVSYQTYGGEVQSVRGVSLKIERGKTVALVGESGCGKTVTSKAIMGLVETPGYLKPGSSILYAGNEITGFTKKQWNAFRGKECGMIFQDALVALNPTMQIGRQILENLKNHFPEIGMDEMKKRSVEMLGKVGIPDAERCMKKYPHELSGGMRQRVMIAMAMITKPSLLIADEPTTALDVTIQAQILRLMKDLQKETNMAILLITHDMGVVAEIADEIVVMYAGKVVEQGNSRDIFYHPQHPYTSALLASVPRIDESDGRELVTIEGNVPNMLHPPQGCGFYSRCPYAMKVCRLYQPDVTDLGCGHETFCWMQDSRAKQCMETAGRAGGQTETGGVI
ncbi:MAG: ABC transporter ATP-binding protein [Eubacteriales bacterium]|nr:ABC transporter ATP-binding protein [Eubacteriales bacterium]